MPPAAGGLRPDPPHGEKGAASPQGNKRCLLVLPGIFLFGGAFFARFLLAKNAPPNWEGPGGGNPLPAAGGIFFLRSHYLRARPKLSTMAEAALAV